MFVHKKRGREELPVQRVPSGKRRCCLTHVGMICDRSDLQPLLPQIVIGNEHTFSAAEFDTLKASCPPNVTLVRQRSAWNNHSLCADIIKLLGKALKDHLDGLHPVLLLDAVRLHFHADVLKACHEQGISVVFVPAKTTWLLQPLDTDAFLRYKSYLREAYQRARVASQSADLSIAQFLPCLLSTIRSILQGSRWGFAFEKDGFGIAQAGIGEFVKRQLGVDARLDLPTSRPTPEQLAQCFPKNAKVPEAALWRTLQAPKPKALPAPAPPPAVPPLACPKPSALLGRTRLQHHLMMAVVAKAKASSSASSSAQGGPAVAHGSRLPGSSVRR